ncbi:YkyA family protein [Virgibacillus alimentarius]|uniref:DNA repair exonuclease SbcCD ATPase subunit n=1 Tax=Virgibacillus alimentarius TaxID=698769 RepID=A0ABS4S670_9BACI|nr:YkyA family protein [Virgibacillus alimentarius]MBP2256914.1 DNA repair exonuclease SbcCD ATPase subunit [Virgibacillus alimentarius]
MNKKLLFFVTMTLLLFISACGKSTEEKIYEHLEEAVTLEEEFEKVQTEITELEKKERELYSTIIELGPDELDKIKETSKQAIETIEKRSNKMESEQESIHASQDEFEKIDKLIEKLEDEKTKNKAREMYEVMMDRYKHYDQLHKEYIKSLKLEKELYQMLQKEELEQEDLTAHIEKINKKYEKVLDKNEEFKEATANYNKLKKEFYDQTDLSVKYDDTSSKNVNGNAEETKEKK